MEKSIAKQLKKDRRHKRIRAKVQGTPERPRLAVHKSNRYINAQIIDDTKGVTLAAISSRNVSGAKGKNMTEAATLAGKELASKAKGAGIEKVVFDRGGYIYTGVIAALAEGAREGGLVF